MGAKLVIINRIEIFRYIIILVSGKIRQMKIILYFVRLTIMFVVNSSLLYEFMENSCYCFPDELSKPAQRVSTKVEHKNDGQFLLSPCPQTIVSFNDWH